MADVPRLRQTVLESSDHLTSSPAGIHSVVSCTGCSSSQLEKDRSPSRQHYLTPCCPLREKLCLASLGVPACLGLSPDRAEEPHSLSSMKPAPCLVGSALVRVFYHLYSRGHSGSYPGSGPIL